MNNKAKLHQQMLSQEMYNDLSPYLIEAREQAVYLSNEYNASYGKPQAIRDEILDRLLEKHGCNTHFEPNFRCEFGYNITLGDNVYANFDLVILDGGKVTIGDRVLIGPKCGIYTSNHAFDMEERVAGACFAKPVHIGNYVWLGANVTITQGVTIGENTIIGAGSVVTKDISANVIAAGVPCRVLRKITKEDRTNYFETKIDR